jgi:hypothetical protein
MARLEEPALTIRHGWVDSVDAISDEAVEVLLAATGDYADVIGRYIDVEGWQSFVDIVGEVRQMFRGYRNPSRSCSSMERSAISTVSYYVRIPR